MKDWQKGIDLETLLHFEEVFEKVNSYSESPFSQIKKNDIAAAMDNGTFYAVPQAAASLHTSRKLCYIKSVAKKKTDIFMYDNVRIGTKEPGDVVFASIATNCDDINKTTGDPFNKDKNNWVTSWAKDENLNEYLTIRKFTRVGSKITTFGEIQFIWFRPAISEGIFGDPTENHRDFPKIPKYEFVTVKKVKDTHLMDLIEEIAKKLSDKSVDALFQNHYSNYNKGKSWSAFSLRGFKSDPTFMTKPIEMNDKWKAEHANEEFVLQDTTLMKDFPEVYNLLNRTFGQGQQYQRIRFMKLKPGDGELTRHTDQVDPEQGLSLGKLARFHFPIKTNPDVKFTVWNTEDVPNTVNMKAGECWVIDVRKPHAAINGGTEERVHLVVDVYVTPFITGMLES